MRDKGVKKAPVGSYVEVGNSVHEFVAGDYSHPHAARIYEIASEINLQMRMAGYVPNTCILMDFDEVPALSVAELALGSCSTSSSISSSRAFDLFFLAMSKYETKLQY
ncbi:Pentatricopeptide repeat-containing protein [Nymphaea thermarum]|nr:Pentatricopeptide repeat-containing protein [Nymphaea thermarum]